MLVLNRNFGESIMIGDNIVIKVLQTHRNQVSLGIEAPRNISVHREEIYQKVYGPIEKYKTQTNEITNIEEGDIPY